MNTKQLLAAAFALVSIQVAAAESPDANVVTTEHLETNAVVKQADIATKLGLTDQDAVFSSPRDFRDANLNELTLEPLEPGSKN